MLLRLITAWIICLCLLSCKPGQKIHLHKQIRDLGWIIGTWDQTLDEQGQVTFEHWEIKTQTEIIGWNLTLAGQDTLFKENLKIQLRGNIPYYIAEVSHNPEPVLFRIIELSTNHFISVNPEHDFPKKIAYYRRGNKIQAKVSGDQRGFELTFVKRKH